MFARIRRVGRWGWQSLRCDDRTNDLVVEPRWRAQQPGAIVCPIQARDRLIRRTQGRIERRRSTQCVDCTIGLHVFRIGRRGLWWRRIDMHLLRGDTRGRTTVERTMVDRPRRRDDTPFLLEQFDRIGGICPELPRLIRGLVPRLAVWRTVVYAGLVRAHFQQIHDALRNLDAELETHVGDIGLRLRSSQMLPQKLDDILGRRFLFLARFACPRRPHVQRMQCSISSAGQRLRRIGTRGHRRQLEDIVVLRITRQPGIEPLLRADDTEPGIVHREMHDAQRTSAHGRPALSTAFERMRETIHVQRHQIPVQGRIGESRCGGIFQKHVHRESPLENVDATHPSQPFSSGAPENRSDPDQRRMRCRFGAMTV